MAEPETPQAWNRALTGPGGKPLAELILTAERQTADEISEHPYLTPGEVIVMNEPGPLAAGPPYRFVATSDPVTFTFDLGPPRQDLCDVNWGSHGCCLPRGHDPVKLPHACDCCECENHPDPDSGCVAKPPYYGPGTRFYGDDAPSASTLDGEFTSAAEAFAGDVETWTVAASAVQAEILRLFGLKPWMIGIGPMPWRLSAMRAEYHRRRKARARRKR